MSRKCTLCGKGPSSGKTISHSHVATNRVFRPNLRRQKIVLNGATTTTYVCTSCIKSGKVIKAS